MTTMLALLCAFTHASLSDAAPPALDPIGRDYCRNGSFAEGLTHWEVNAQHAAHVRVVDVTDQPFAKALEIDARGAGRIGLQTERFPIEPHRRYRFSAMVQRIAGEQGWSLHVSFRNAEDEQLAYEYVHVTPLAGEDWFPYGFECIAPEQAVYARIAAEVPAGWGVRLSRVRFIGLEPVGPRLAIDLMPDALPSDPATSAAVRLRIENRGDAVLTDVEATLSVPEGMQVVGADRVAAERLAYGEDYSAAFEAAGRPDEPDASYVCTVSACHDGRPVALSARTPVFLTTPEPRPTATADLEPPTLPDMDTRLGCYYFPVMLDWDRNNWGVRPVDYLEPLLGYYDEALPEVTDWHIKWAVEHGISFFVFDWYFNQGMDYLNDALEKGFMQSRFVDRMQFCVDWCNEGHCGQFKPVDFGHEALNDFITTLCERYFSHPSYLRVDGKPVALIHVPLKIVNAHGGWDGCREALERMRDTARAHGHPGVYFVAVQNNLPYLVDYKKGGFDAVTAYAYGFRDRPMDFSTRSMPFEPLIPRHHECFAIAREEAHRLGLDYIPSAWVGWDDAARSKENAVRTTGNTPAAFRRMVEALPHYVESDTRLALFESWNEWGEGGQAEPGQQYGFGRLSALRDVLTRARGPYAVPTPTPKDVARFNTDVTWDDVEREYLSRYARQLGLDQGLSLDFDGPRSVQFRPAQGIAGFGIADGELRARSESDDPALIGPPSMMLPAERVASVRVRLQADAGDRVQIFWRRDGDDGWTEEASVTVPLRADGAYHVYAFDVGASPEWRGVIAQLRLDPTDAPAEIAVDWVRTAPE